MNTACCVCLGIAAAVILFSLLLGFGIDALTQPRTIKRCAHCARKQREK